MVAPIDAKLVLDIEGEPITLRLDFAGLAMCEHLGVDLFSEDGVPRKVTKIALVVKSLATTDHPTMTTDEALSIVAKIKPLAIISKVIELVTDFGAQADASTEGKGVKAPSESQNAA
ncbi:hypothetical protein [Novosphingobium guangzhouense]|uniref:Phage tail protein n=1 Tax=Novosphingobium guangzhouense TaxID=1850347 RepID=A0A2K2FUT2_9SPHN|nr:hypothetical protein [Novosphingobium guangzhouense]PNU02518.1 hypothetical protein A8V01_09060 [Novosphingobium guangzhouense]